MFFFFFFKQKTAYEMRISDWSSDVCSSDLLGPAISRRPLSVRIGATQTSTRVGTHGLMPLPQAGGEDMRSMLFTEMEAPAAPRVFAPEPEPVAASEVLERIAASEGLHEDVDAPPVFDIVEAAAEAEQSDAVVIETLREMLSDPDCR